MLSPFAFCLADVDGDLIRANRPYVIAAYFNAGRNGIGAAVGGNVRKVGDYLNVIGAHGFNMRSLRSRPMKDLQWNYFFYIEAEGNVNTENGRDMLRELSAICAKLKLVGTYYSKLSTQDGEE